MSVKLALPVALLAVLALSACQEDEPTGGSADDPTSEATTSDAPSPTETTPSASESASTSTGGATASAVTAPGTELAIGDSAVLPLTYGTNGQATVEVTVTGIEKGTSADLASAKVENAADYTPFYIQLELTLLDRNDDFGSYSPGSDFDGLTGSSTAGSLIIIGDFAPCEDGGFEYDAEVGATATGCVPALATKGSVVDGVQFSGGPDDAGYDRFDGKPVVWR